MELISRHVRGFGKFTYRSYRPSMLVGSGGGGGRPGGRPAFNWKVKKAIDMGFEVNEVKADELKTFGDFEDLKKILDFSKAKKVDLTDSIEYVSEGTNQSEEYEDEYAGMTGFRKAGIRKKVKHTRGPRPVVDMSQLYGSHKVAYRIPDLHDPKREKKRFSHKRVFGTAESA